MGKEKVEKEGMQGGEGRMEILLETGEGGFSGRVVFGITKTV